MTKHIEERIQALTLEQQALQTNHENMVKMNQQSNREFQEQVVKNQTRFAQIMGALNELNQLKETNNESINVNRSYAATSGNTDRFPSHYTDTGSTVRNPVGDRELDQSGAAAG